jgi:hypothetical protein
MIITMSGIIAPVMGIPIATDESSTTKTVGTTPTPPMQIARDNSKVDVAVGAQLSTVISISSDEVQTDFENTAFEISIDSATEVSKAEIIAERADELRNRAESISNDYQDLTEAYRNGKLTKSEYARRLAVLNSRASNVLTSYNQLQKRTANISAGALRTADVDQSALDRSIENLENVTGAGMKALFNQFAAESDGEIKLEIDDGLSITVKSENGEFSREVEQQRDDKTNFSITQPTALEVAREGLSTPQTGEWTLSRSKVDTSSGSYEFEFIIRNAPAFTGEAEIAVDGSSGDIFSLEEEIETLEPESEAEDERENDTDDEQEDNAEDERENDTDDEQKDSAEDEQENDTDDGQKDSAEDNKEDDDRDEREK